MSQAPSHITPKQFLEWRSPRRGATNPHEMSNDVWAWLIETRLNAYTANETFDGPSSYMTDAGPCWSFKRFGRSETLLPDGRTVLIAGEHEDAYDPDFFIYNDVVIIEKTGEKNIFGYPVDVFPPTDFHSATLVGNDIILIGNLGYPQDRRPQQTPVLRLELDTWRISPIETFGECPGRIHGHTAELSADKSEILISGGEIDRGNEWSFVENIDEWSIDLQTRQWKRLTRRQWYRFKVFRQDKEWNHLWKLEQILWLRETIKKEIPTEEKQKIEKELKQKIAELNQGKGISGKILGKLFPCYFVPDLNLLETLYAPEIATEIIKRKVSEDDDDEVDDYHVHRIRIGDVIVRYVEDWSSINVTVEGELPQEIVEQLKKDLMDKFAALERAKISCRIIPFE
jgi:hypothetical protein